MQTRKRKKRFKIREKRMFKTRFGFRGALLSLVTVAALSLTGCQMMSDLFPFFKGDEDAPNVVDVPADEGLPAKGWTEPGAEVAAPDEWAVVKSVKFPIIYTQVSQHIYPSFPT